MFEILEICAGQYKGFAVSIWPTIVLANRYTQKSTAMNGINVYIGSMSRFQHVVTWVTMGLENVP